MKKGGKGTKSSVFLFARHFTDRYFEIMSPKEERHAGFSAVIFGIFACFWICLIVLFAAQVAFATGQPWLEAFRGAFFLWMPWILISPLMLLMGYALPWGGSRLLAFLPCHLVACALLLYFGGWLSRNMMPPPPEERMEERGVPPFDTPPGPGIGPRGPSVHLPRGSAANFLHSLPIGLPLYLSAILLVSSLRLRELSLEREKRAMELERQLVETRLQTLRSQLQPHFLFNTLNTLAELVHSDANKAEDILLNLSALLRASLETRDKTLIPLRREMDLARDYLAIQQVRHGNRISVQENIPAETLSCAVPPLILQPALENAIKHAVESSPGNAVIRLLATRENDKLVIEVEDTGAGDHSIPREGHGLGIANVRERLEASFPTQSIAFQLFPNHHGGITARFEMPIVAA